MSMYILTYSRTQSRDTIKSCSLFKPLCCNRYMQKCFQELSASYFTERDLILSVLSLRSSNIFRLYLTLSLQCTLLSVYMHIHEDWPSRRFSSYNNKWSCQLNECYVYLSSTVDNVCKHYFNINYFLLAIYIFILWCLFLQNFYCF